MLRRVLLLLPLVVLPVACGDDDDGADASLSTPACDVVGDTDASPTSEVVLTLDEWSIRDDGEAAPAGAVRLTAVNEGDVEHELVIEKADGSRIGEIEPFASGAECAGTFDLTAGTYDLFCEIVDESGVSHADAGMKAELKVT